MCRCIRGPKATERGTGTACQTERVNDDDKGQLGQERVTRAEGAAEEKWDNDANTRKRSKKLKIRKACDGGWATKGEGEQTYMATTCSSSLGAMA
eukprot:6199735-Pleurochrysis_carterae.AAC.1